MKHYITPSRKVLTEKYDPYIAAEQTFLYYIDGYEIFRDVRYINSEFYVLNKNIIFEYREASSTVYIWKFVFDKLIIQFKTIYNTGEFIEYYLKTILKIKADFVRIEDDNVRERWLNVKMWQKL